MTGELPRPAYLSPSAADTYESCPQKWYAKYVMKVPDPAGPEAEVGTLAHAVLEGLAAFPPGERTAAAALALADEQWAGVDRGQRRLAWGHVVRALRNLEVTHGDVVSAEEVLEVSIGGVPFKGIIDRADELPSGAVRILDYKTGKRPGRSDWLEDKRRTLMLYAAGFEVAHERPVQEAALVWTATGVVDDFDVDDFVVAGAVKWFAGVWNDLNESLDSGDFPPRPGNLCSWCPGAGNCSAGQEAILARAREGKSIGPFGEPIVAAAEAAGRAARAAARQQEA